MRSNTDRWIFGNWWGVECDWFLDKLVGVGVEVGKLKLIDWLVGGGQGWLVDLEMFLYLS